MQAATATLARWLPRDGAGRSMLTLGLGQVCGQALLLGAMPLLTRLYDPTAFGLFATYNIIVGIWSVVTTLRYEAAIPLAEERRSAWHLLFLSLGLTLLVAAVAGTVFLLVGDWALPRLQAAELRAFIVLAAVNIAACGVYQVFTYWLLRDRAFKHLAAARVGLSAATVCTQIVLGLALATHAGLILGHLIGYAAAGVLAAVLAFKGQQVHRLSAGELRAVAKRFRRFPLIGTWGALVAILAALLPTLLVAALFGPAAAGLFVLAHRCLSVPSAMVQNPVSRVYLSEAARLRYTRPDELPRLYRLTALRILAAGVPAVLLAMLVAPAAFEFVFGPEWRTAGVLCMVLAPMMLAQLTWQCVQPTLDVIGRQDLDFGFSSLHVLLAVAGLSVTAYSGASVVVSAAAMSGCCCLALLASLALTARVLPSQFESRQTGIAPSPTWEGA